MKIAIASDIHLEFGPIMLHNRPQIRLWVHGHMHNASDYMLGTTRVVCNPRGYTGYESRADQFELQHLEI
jgi:predicted phosphodiesterase